MEKRKSEDTRDQRNKEGKRGVNKEPNQTPSAVSRG